MTHTRLHRTVWQLAAVSAILSIASCEKIFKGNDYMTLSVPPERMHEIESIDLSEQSTEAPVSVDDATESLTEASLVERLLNPLPPPAEIELTVEQVRAEALANNLDLQVQLLSPSIAQAAVDAEEAKLESTFFGSITRDERDSPTPTPLIQGSQTDSTFYDVGVNIPLRTGGTITIDVPFSDIDTNNPSAFLNPSYNADLRFSISQPLLRNAWERTNTYSIRVAKYQKQITDAQTKLEAIRVLANAGKAYWRVYAAQRELEVRQQQFELAIQQLERARRLVEAGDAAEIEVIRSESGAAQRLEGIIISETLVSRTTRDLKRILHREDLPIGGATAIQIATDPRPLGLRLDSDALAAFAVENRMEMLELELQAAINASTIDLRRNEKLPLITLDYNYSFSGLGSDYNDAFDQIGRGSFADWSLALRAEVPIGNEAAKANFHRAVLDRLQTLATTNQREEAIRQEVYDALDQLQQNWQRIIAARTEVMLATRTYQGEERQFEVGARTSTDVLDAAARLADAQSSEIRALADYEIAMIDLAFATGTLLGHDRVRWQAIDPGVEDYQ